MRQVLCFGPYCLAAAQDNRGVRHGYWVLPAVRHPLTGQWYSPVLSTAQVEKRATQFGWTVEILTTLES